MSESPPSAEGRAQPNVRLAQLLAGATPFRHGNINDTYRGVIMTEAGERTAVIKDLESKELANEVLGSALGLTQGLPVPPPFLTFAHPERFRAQKGPVLGEGRLLFASVDVRQPQVAFLYNSGGGRRVLDRLAAWGGSGYYMALILLRPTSTGTRETCFSRAITRCGQLTMAAVSQGRFGKLAICALQTGRFRAALRSGLPLR